MLYLYRGHNLPSGFARCRERHLQDIRCVLTRDSFFMAGERLPAGVQETRGSHCALLAAAPVQVPLKPPAAQPGGGAV